MPVGGGWVREKKKITAGVWQWVTVLALWGHNGWGNSYRALFSDGLVG
jgi:hypothetical protein